MQKLQTQQNRIAAYDVMRIALIVLVVLGHSGYVTINFGVGGVNFGWPANAHPIQNSFIFRHLRDASPYLYSFHMALFFMLSGAVSYTQPAAYLGFKSLLQKKAKRLLLPYLLCGLLFMLPIKWLVGGYRAQSIPTALGNFLLGIADTGHLWFLLALFWCFVIFYALYHGVYRSTGKMVLAVLAAAAIQAIFYFVPVNMLELGRALTNIFWFALGVYFEYHRPKLEKLLRRFLPLPIVLLAAGAVLAVQDYRYKFLPANARIVAFWLLLYCAGFFITSHTALASMRLFRFLAGRSMDIYLYHDPLEYVVLALAFAHGWLASAGGSVAYLLLRTLGVVAISMLLGLVLKLLKNRLKNLSRNLPGRLEYFGQVW